MIKIIDLKSCIVDLKKEESKLKKESLKIIRQKEKVLNKKLESLFLEAVHEIKWRIEIYEGSAFFYHNRDWVSRGSLRFSKSINKPLAKQKRIGALRSSSVGMSGLVSPPKASKVSLVNTSPDMSIINTKFARLFKFLENEFESSYIKCKGSEVHITYEGFIIPISSQGIFSDDNIEDSLNTLTNFIKKTKIRLNLEAFNAETEYLENELELRKKFLNNNSNAFLFGL